MTRPFVLEFIRDPSGMWNLPPEHVDALAREFPDVRFASPQTREEALALLPEADVLLGYLLRPDNFALAKRLRWVHSTAAGVTGLLFPEFNASGIVLTNARGLHARSMSEHALALMLAMGRQLPRSLAAQQRATWDQTGQRLEPPGFAELGGSTLAVVGFGHIGRAIGALGRAFGMHVLAVRRHPGDDPAPAHEVFGPEALDQVLERADWVVLVTPQTSETVRLFGAARFARMKRGARFINLGRGALVDEAALAGALRSGQLAGAALDVFDEEPLGSGSPLWSEPGLIVTPHVAGIAPRYWERALVQFSANLRRFLAGETLTNLVDKQAGY